MKHNYFTNPRNWYGSYYELSIEYHPTGDNNRLNDALIALCNSESFHGLWKEKKDYGKNPISLPIKVEDDSVTSFYGTLSLFEKNEIPCLVSVIRVNGESDWIDIAIPLLVFEKEYAYQYPLKKELNPWLVEVNGLYIKLAETLFKDSPFDFAMVGEEISGYTNYKELTDKAMKDLLCILPTHLQNRLGLQNRGEELSKGLRIFNT